MFEYVRDLIIEKSEKLEMDDFAKDLQRKAMDIERDEEGGEGVR